MVGICIGHYHTVMGKAKEEDEESKELTNGLLFYSQRLQMWFHKGTAEPWQRRVDNEGIRITFRCIDKNHPKRRFYVVLNVNDEQKWERLHFTLLLSVVLRTKPELKDTTQLVSSLNATNDINGFLRCVRKEFKAQFCDDMSPVCEQKNSLTRTWTCMFRLPLRKYQTQSGECQPRPSTSVPCGRA